MRNSEFRNNKVYYNNVNNSLLEFCVVYVIITLENNSRGDYI